MNKSYRAYNKTEITELRNRKLTTWKHIENFGMKWIFVTLIFIGPFMLYEKWIKEVPPQIELPIVVILEIIAIGTVLYIMYKMGELSWNKNIEQEILIGQAEVVSIKTDKVFKRVDPNDYGSGFYIKINNQETLFLQGQYFDELQYTKKFPNTEFEVIRTSFSNELLLIDSKGKYLNPEQNLPPFTKQQYKSGEIHYNGDILQIPIEQIK